MTHQKRLIWKALSSIVTSPAQPVLSAWLTKPPSYSSVSDITAEGMFESILYCTYILAHILRISLFRLHSQYISDKQNLLLLH